MIILWPAFLVAIVAEGFLFSVIDPADISFFHNHVDLSPIAIYTVGFFCIWLFCSLASMLTYYLACVPGDRSPPL
jgi:hypothetical protein